MMEKILVLPDLDIQFSFLKKFLLFGKWMFWPVVRVIIFGIFGLLLCVYGGSEFVVTKGVTTDEVLHFLGGVGAADVMAALYMFFHRNTSHRFFGVLVALMGACLFGVFWEFAEYTRTNFFPDGFFPSFLDQVLLIGSFPDTMLDLFLDCLGGFLYGVCRFFSRH